jgi:hypothetical protein
MPRLSVAQRRRLKQLVAAFKRDPLHRNFERLWLPPAYARGFDWLAGRKNDPGDARLDLKILVWLEYVCAGSN